MSFLVQYLQQPQLQPQQQIHYRPAPVPKQTLAVVPQRPRAQAYQQQPQDNQRLNKPEEAEEEEEYEVSNTLLPARPEELACGPMSVLSLAFIFYRHALTHNG